MNVHFTVLTVVFLRLSNNLPIVNSCLQYTKQMYYNVYDVQVHVKENIHTPMAFACNEA